VALSCAYQKLHIFKDMGLPTVRLLEYSRAKSMLITPDANQSFFAGDHGKGIQRPLSLFNLP